MTTKLVETGRRLRQQRHVGLAAIAKYSYVPLVMVTFNTQFDSIT